MKKALAAALVSPLLISCAGFFGYVRWFDAPDTAHAGETIQFTFDFSTGNQPANGTGRLCVSTPADWTLGAARVVEPGVTPYDVTPIVTTVQALKRSCFTAPNALHSTGVATISTTVGAAGAFEIVAELRPVDNEAPSVIRAARTLRVDQPPVGIGYLTRLANTSSILSAFGAAASDTVAVFAGSTQVLRFDGTNTQSLNVPVPTVRGAAFGNGRFVVAGVNSASFSTDGLNWTSATTPPAGSVNGVIWGSNRFVAFGENGYIATSPDGAVWTDARIAAFTTSLWSGASHDNLEVLAGANGSVAVARDGGAFAQTTLQVTPPLTATVFSVAYADGVGFAMLEGQRIAVSQDLVTATSVAVPDAGTGHIAAGDHRVFVLTGQRYHIYDGTTLTSLPVATNCPLGAGAVFNGALFVTTQCNTVMVQVNLPQLAVSSNEVSVRGNNTKVTVRNSGRGLLYLNAIAAPAGFTVSGCSELTLDTGASCELTLKASNDDASGILEISGQNVANGLATQSIALEASSGGDGGCAATPMVELAALAGVGMLAMYVVKRRRASNR